VTDQLITLVDLLQPVCTRVYGEAPCTAEVGVTGAAKCYNTRATCQDPENYNAGTLTLRFGSDQEGLEAYGYVLPVLNGMSIAPLSVNLGGMDSSSSPFGRRESATISFNDFKHSDLLVDPYRLDRVSSYESGTFWGKWMARNPYAEGMRVQIHQGTVGQLVSEMETRHYIIDRITGPADGRVSVVAKDVFSLAEQRKAKAPRASRGELRTGFDELHAGTFQITPVEIADDDYDDGQFFVAINDEVILVERTAGSGTFTIIARGAAGTEADEHEAGDKVQQVLEYDAELSHDIVYNLLTEYAGIDPALIDLSAWDTEMAARPELLSALVAEPTPVDQLVGEIAEQIGFTIWPSTIDNEIKLKVIQFEADPSPVVTDDAWMIDGSYSSRRLSTQRVSQVWVYYGQRNPLEPLDDPRNYHARRVFADLTAESADNYGSPAIREVFSRWIPQFGGSIATQTGDRILSLFRDPPLQVSFTVHKGRSGELSIGEQFTLRTRDEQGVDGAEAVSSMIPIEIVRKEDRIEVLAQQVRFYLPAPEARSIEIDADTNNVNMRTLYNALFGTPPPGERVTVTVLAGVTVGSSDPSLPAMDTGDWPQGIDLNLIIQATARILGAGGDGGDDITPTAGGDGGTALRAAAPLVIVNNGTIGGGGGGGGGALSIDGPVTARARGGGGAGRVAGDGYENGTDTEGGFGQYSEVVGEGVEATVAVAIGGDGGDLGQPGTDGQGILAGAGGASGVAVDGGIVFFDVLGTILGEIIGTEPDGELSPPAEVPTGLALATELVLLSSGAYSNKLVFSFTRPDDARIISFEVQVKTPSDPTTWRSLYDSYANRFEWTSPQIGLYSIRVRSVYFRDRAYSEYASISVATVGAYDAMSAIGISDPIDPLLFITLDPARPTARIRIQAQFIDDTGISPDEFLLFYTSADYPNAFTVTSDTGTRLYIDEASVVLSLFNLTVSSGSTETVVKFTNTAAADIDLSGFWWASVRNDPGAASGYFKVNRTTVDSIYFAARDALAFVPVAGQLIDVAELLYSDSRATEFSLGYANGEVIRHAGIKFDGSAYYLDVVGRAAEGTTQGNQAGQVLNYYPAPGALTNVVSIPIAQFEIVDGVYFYTGDIPVDIPSNFGWAAVTCCLVNKATNISGTQYVRSNIVPLTVAGAA
jgi:hypothetical protein